MDLSEMMTAAAGPVDDGYSGVTHAGIALVKNGEVLLAQRAMDPTDDPDVQQTWEFPGGGLEPGEEVWTAATREFGEEVGFPLPEDAKVVNGWRSDDGVYQGFVVSIEGDFVIDGWEPNDEVQAVAWVAQADLPNYTLRPEVEMGTDWSMIFGVSGNEDEMAETDDMDFDVLAAAPDLIMVHGVLAPEEAPSGDGRGFTEGSMSARPFRLALGWQKWTAPGHDQSVTVGSIDRLMRKDGLIHWEGSLLDSEEADDLTGLLAHFGRYGISVDGVNGSTDTDRSEAEGITWYDAVKAAGGVACSIPAYQEAYISLGPHPTMPAEGGVSEDGTTMVAGGNRMTFDRGPGWVTDPKATNRIHDYWTKKGEPGYAKVGWGTPGDFTRAKRLIGEKIAKNSPDKMRFLNQIIAQWHFDALGYWPGDLGKPGNAPDTPENRKRAAIHATADDEVDFEVLHDLIAQSDNVSDVVSTTDDESVWEAVLVSSVSGNERKRPPLAYFHRQDSTEALHVSEPDADGFVHTYGYAAERGVCHIGFSDRCVEPPIDESGDYPDFHLGRTKTSEGFINTGVLTYGIGHRDAKTILSESATQSYFDNVRNAWAAVRCGTDDRGIWFSGVVLPKVDHDDLTLIQASGQVSGEWRSGSLRACLTVNVPGFPVVRASAEYDENGNVMAMAASAFGALTASVNGVENSPCTPDSPAARMEALRQIDAEVRFTRLKESGIV